jgi:hypothetical protein
MAGGESVTFNEKINWNLTPISQFLQAPPMLTTPSKQGFLSVL